MRSDTKDFSFVLSGARVGESIFLGIHICSTRWQREEWLLSILSYTQPKKSFYVFPLCLQRASYKITFIFCLLLDTLNRWLPIMALHVYSSKLFNLFCVGQINFCSNSAATPSTAYILAGTDEFCHATSSLVFFRTFIQIKLLFSPWLPYSLPQMMFLGHNIVLILGSKKFSKRLINFVNLKTTLHFPNLLHLICSYLIFTDIHCCNFQTHGLQYIKS